MAKAQELLDYLTETFGDRRFLRREVTSPLWAAYQVEALRAYGLLAWRTVPHGDPRLAPRSGNAFEYRVVAP